MKEDVRLVIKDLEYACRQSLYNGISGTIGDTNGGSLSDYEQQRPASNIHLGVGVALPPAKRQCRNDRVVADKARSWDVILAEASNLLWSMTEYEHGQVSRFAGILLLGFFLPQSTGNNFFSLQNVSTRRPMTSRQQRQKQQSQSTGIQPPKNLTHNKGVSDQQIILMSLEERLESSPHRYGNEFGELDDVIVHEHVESAFFSFLKIGLRPFLSGRPAHSTQVDVIHLLAMAIHPRPSDQCIRQTTSRLEEQKSEVWEMTTRLMSSLAAHSFQINYRHRVELVRVVLDCLVLPECGQEAGIYKNAPLFEGAIPHLRASLYAFGMASMSPYDSHLSQRGMVSLAIQSGIDHVVKEEWSRLLHRMVDDQTNYSHCSDDMTDGQTTATVTTSSTTNQLSDKDFCPHTARGELLRSFLIRYNEARHFAEEEFLQYALSSLTDAIEMQVDCWTKEEEAESKDTGVKPNSREGNYPVGDSIDMILSSNQPPLVLASLLNSAKDLFHFLLPLKNNGRATEGDGHGGDEVYESEDSHHRDMLISCAIQLIHHWDPKIVKEACTLLVLAFSYSDDMWEDYIGAVFDSTVIALDIAMKRKTDKHASRVAIEGLVSAFSQRSPTFAVNLFRLLLKKGRSSDRNSLVIFRLIAAIANARPAVVQERIGTVTDYLNEVKDQNAKKHILASILSCRRTHYFANETDSLTNLMPKIHSSLLGNWDKYLLSRHALLTGNFVIAKELYRELMKSAATERSFLWLSAMENIADGEAQLCRAASGALPESTSKFRRAIGTLRSLEALKYVSTTFQIRILELRVSFLDLLTNMRQLTIEMRLIGTETKKYTRPNIHQKNFVKLFRKLSIDYLRIYKQYGLFICQQSRSAMRTLHVLCSFVAKAGARVFADSIVLEEERINKVFAHGDGTQPITMLMKQLDTFALEKLNKFVDVKIRAVTLLEFMDRILKTPTPIPRSLVCPKKLPDSHLQLVFDPDTHDGDEYPINIRNGTHLSFIASGKVPASLMSLSQIPFNKVLLWYEITFTGGSKKKSNLSQKLRDIDRSPIATSVSSAGSFSTKVDGNLLLNEGCYTLEFRLGCRDIRGGEWELPMDKTQHYSVKVV